ncbi:MAG TPA: GNVR domain-containing protein, partial [Planctomycetaceae bacterium]|nr:GNVR domain-containing protein [Planctomycetaceae bacterium]
FVDQLVALNERIAADRARSNRDFIFARLDEVRSALDSARSGLERFQMENKAIDFDQQTRLAIEQAATLKVSLAEVELKLALKEKKLGKDNAELIELRREREIIRGQLDRLETTNPDSSFFSLPVASIPSLKGQYEQLYSAVQVNETLYDLLLRQSEQAKIAENDKGSTISVLDRAVPPEEKSRPRRGRIVIGAFVIAFILSILIAAIIDYVARLENLSPENYRRAQAFIGAFFGWLPGIKKRK